MPWYTRYPSGGYGLIPVICRNVPTIFHSVRRVKITRFNAMILPIYLIGVYLYDGINRNIIASYVTWYPANSGCCTEM